MQHIHDFSYIAYERPALLGAIKGGIGHEDINGTVAVFRLPEAVYLEAQLYGLPREKAF